MLSSDEALPCDRPNLSKDYLAGTIPFEYVPLKDEGFYAKNNVEAHFGRTARELDLAGHQVLIEGEAIPYDPLLMATGAEPVRLEVLGADQAHVHTLRSLADCHAIIESAKASRQAVVIGVSFIGGESPG
ncbi:MAG: FAD-dependent oxidoreductase, partial [Actinomycetota bacterium]